MNLYGVVGPSDDPNLHVEWFHNGKPLLNGEPSLLTVDRSDFAKCSVHNCCACVSVNRTCVPK